MRNVSSNTKTVSVPESIIRKWQGFVNEFEDFLLSQNKDFIKKMRGARKEHVAGKLTDLDV